MKQIKTSNSLVATFGIKFHAKGFYLYTINRISGIIDPYIFSLTRIKNNEIF